VPLPGQGAVQNRTAAPARLRMSSDVRFYPAVRPARRVAGVLSSHPAPLPHPRVLAHRC
jgi:hypothetical protein